jgi:hypothetical protein
VFGGLEFAPDVRILIICWVPVHWNLHNSEWDWATLAALALSVRVGL